MTDDKDRDAAQAGPAQVETEPPPEALGDDTDASESGGRGRAVLVLAVLLLAAGVYYWYAFVHAPAMTELRTRVDGVSTARADLAARLDESDARVTELVASNDALRAELGALRQAQKGVEDSVTALYAQESSESLSWVLAEAEYLVLAATQRLALEHDVRTAVAALKAADERLRSAEHPELISVRAQLAKDIAALEAVALPDVEGLAIYLAEAVARVGDLPTKPIGDLDMSFTRMREQDATTENWKGMVKAMWADLVSLVEIKDGELPDGVLFDPELRYFLQQNLRLELASARLSVLRRDNANFRAASRLIIDLLNQYYDTSDAAVGALTARLNEAQAIDLDPEFPPVAASLDTVRAKRLSLREAQVRGVAARD